MSANKDSGLQSLLNKYLLPAIFHPAGKAIIVLIAVALAVVGRLSDRGIGITERREGLPFGFLAPDDHYFRDFSDAALNFESSSGKFLFIWHMRHCGRFAAFNKLYPLPSSPLLPFRLYEECMRRGIAMQGLEQTCTLGSWTSRTQPSKGR